MTESINLAALYLEVSRCSFDPFESNLIPNLSIYNNSVKKACRHTHSSSCPVGFVLGSTAGSGWVGRGLGRHQKVHNSYSRHSKRPT